MRDGDCVAFLQAVLPRLRMRWDGFRKVRRQVCKRLDRRRRALGLPDLTAYRAYLDDTPDEWAVLDTMCRITISRFYRDRGLFDTLRDQVLPLLAEEAVAQGKTTLYGWSAGCASGEEAYTLKILWRHALQPAYPHLSFVLTATDAGAHMLERARRGQYAARTLREMPEVWRQAAFSREGHVYNVRPPYRSDITWMEQDLRSEMPDGPFHLVLCRNLVFTYFEPRLQQTCLDRLLSRLAPGGFLVLGKHELIPEGNTSVRPWDSHQRIYRKHDE